TGSDGSGYNLAKSFGHSIIETIPGIVQLKLDNPYLKSISGVKFDGYAVLLVDDEPVRKEFGEILFTDYGISGPPIMQLSGHASKALLRRKKVEIVVDMIPNQTINEIQDFIENHFAVFSHRPVIDSLVGIVNKKLIPTLLKEAPISNLHCPCNDLNWSEKKRLIELLKHWKFRCIGTNGFNQAQVTIGGVNT
ncbi:aminoacetone oxidase family FAD-binding enzyme, partial [Clostridium perfringens]